MHVTLPVGGELVKVHSSAKFDIQSRQFAWHDFPLELTEIDIFFENLDQPVSQTRADSLIIHCVPHFEGRPKTIAPEVPRTKKFRQVNQGTQSVHATE